MAAKKKITEGTTGEGAQTPAAASLQTKSVMMSGMLAMMASMSPDDMVPWYQDAMELAGQTPDASKQNAASIQMKGAVAEDAKALFAGDDLTEEAQTKVLTLIEHAVTLSEGLMRQQLEEEYETKLTESTAELQEAMADKIDQYLSYVAEDWRKKNSVAIESALKVERATRFFDALGTLMSEMKIVIPEGSENVVEGMQAQLDKANADLNESIENNIALQESLTRATALNVFKDVTEGMTKIDIEKFKTLVENVDISDDADEMRAKLTTIKEAHLKAGTIKAKGAAEGLSEAMTVPAGSDSLTEEKTVAPVVDSSIARAVALMSGKGR